MGTLLFWFYPGDFSNQECDTLRSCLYVTINFGLRSSGGVGDYAGMEPSALMLGRFLIDLGYFLIVLIVLMNVIFGIILDTFSELRSDKMERLRDTTEVCFICGIEKITFDRASEAGHNGFRRHIKDDHYMWNY